MNDDLTISPYLLCAKPCHIICTLNRFLVSYHLYLWMYRVWLIHKQNCPKNIIVVTNVDANISTNGNTISIYCPLLSVRHVTVRHDCSNYLSFWISKVIYIPLSAWFRFYDIEHTLTASIVTNKLSSISVLRLNENSTKVYI